MSHHHFPARGIGIEGGSALFGQRRQQHGSSSRDRLRRVAILAACALGAVGSLVLLLNGGGSATPSEAGAEAATAGEWVSFVVDAIRALMACHEH